jgi:dTDP-4-dehydrorhamnose reductase
MLAEITALLLTGAGKDTAEWIMARRGLYHLAGDGFASRYEWAKAILTYDPNREEQIAQKINIANTVDFPTPARRPLYSALDCNNFHQTFGLSLPHWEAALQMALN